MIGETGVPDGISGAKGLIGLIAPWLRAGENLDSHVTSCLSEHFHCNVELKPFVPAVHIHHMQHLFFSAQT